jgi:hypothetical protein
MADWRVGLFFHTLYPDDHSDPAWRGKPKHQGHVLREVTPGAFEVQYFSWMMGDPSTREVQPASYFDGALWYATDEEMQRAGSAMMGGDPEEQVQLQRELKRLYGVPSPTPAEKPAAAKPADKSQLRAVSKALRFKIFKRDHFTCTYCGKRAGPDVELEIDHIMPLAKGGKDEEANLTTSCHACNRGKRDIPIGH